jgi:hypothetical protein
MTVRPRTGLILVGIACALLVVLIFLMPILLNADRYRTKVVSYLEEKIGKKVEIGRLAVTFSPRSDDSGGRFRGEESTVVSPELHGKGGADRCAA